MHVSFFLANQQIPVHMYPFFGIDKPGTLPASTIGAHGIFIGSQSRLRRGQGCVGDHIYIYIYI